MTTTRILIAGAFVCICVSPAAAQAPVAPVPPMPPAAPVRVGVLPTQVEPHAVSTQVEPHFWGLEPHFTGFDHAELEAITQSAREIAESMKDFHLLAQGPVRLPAVPPLPPMPPMPSGPFFYNEGAAESQYERARNYIDRDQYDQALGALERVIGEGGARVDAAMYWKAYSLNKVARRADALATIAELQKRFAKSAWVNDARYLEAELRQASGQGVSAESQADEELKLLALSGLMRTDPETALPTIEKMLAGPSNVRIKDRALFVVSQSRSARGRELIASVAKGASNPDLKLSAIRYLGRMQGPEVLQTLDDVYRGSSDSSIKRTIIRSFGQARARDRLLGVAKSETSAELRGEAVQQLGAMRAAAELEDLYRSETNSDVKKRILQGLVSANAVDRLGPIARNEKDPELRRTAIRQLGASNRADATETLTAIYNADSSMETRKAVIDALGSQRNATPLVNLARAEKNPELKKEMVQRLSNMRTPEAREYMLELLK